MKHESSFGRTALMGLGLSLMPLPALQRLTDDLCHRLNRRYPALKTRLADAEGRLFHFQIEDLAFDALMRIRKGGLTLKLIRKTDTPVVADVRLKGQSGRLLDMMQGHSDADALFFARDLQVSGDTGALVSLRNALESQDIVLMSLFAEGFGPLKPLAQRSIGYAETRINRLSADIDRLYQTTRRPFDQAMAQQTRRIETLEARLSQVEKSKVKT